MTLPPHTTALSEQRGFEVLTFELPSLRLADGNENPVFAARVSVIADAARALEPWTLLQPIGEQGLTVATHRTGLRGWLMRRYVRWLNVQRRVWLADWKRRRAAHFSDASVKARAGAAVRP